MISPDTAETLQAAAVAMEAGLTKAQFDEIITPDTIFDRSRRFSIVSDCVSVSERLDDRQALPQVRSAIPSFRANLRRAKMWWRPLSPSD